MKPIPHAAALAGSTAACCDVLAHGSVCAPLEAFPSLRLRPGPGLVEPLPAAYLKHYDEQAIAAQGAVLEAAHQAGLNPGALADWGIVAAPCFLGRATLVTAHQRYAAEGAWGISPHFIPHRSQHAVSGTISQVLKIHGPNFGVGGGPGAVAEALLAGAALLVGNRLPGVWVVMTGWDPEYIPDRSGKPTTATVCRAVALALVPGRPDREGIWLRVVPGRMGDARGSGDPANPLVPNMEAILAFLADGATPTTTVVWKLETGGWLEFGRGGRHHPPFMPPHHRLSGNGQQRQHSGGAGTEKKR